MRKLVTISALLVACDGGAPEKDSAPASTAKAPSSVRSSASESAATAGASSPTGAAPPKASAAGSLASASASSSAATRADPCEGARKFDDARFCITLPPDTLDVSYEASEKGDNGTQVIEDKGVTLRLSWAIPADPKWDLKESLAKATPPEELVGTGSLKNGGLWADIRRAPKDGRPPAHDIDAVFKSSRWAINCHWTDVPEERVARAVAACQSIKLY